MIDPSLVSVALQLNSDGTDTDIITVQLLRDDSPSYLD